MENKIYNHALNYLISHDSISKQEIEKHLIPLHQKPNDFNIIFKRFCETAQNKQMSVKVIGNSIGGVEKLSPILFDFNPHKVAAKYSSLDAFHLFEEIKLKLNPSGKVRDTKKSLWPLYCKTIIDSAHFLANFKTINDFYEWAHFYTNDTRSKPALPLMISIEISGIGFPLACDFLKEIGFEEYGKPDVHIKEIFKALNIINPNEKSTLKQDYEALKAMDRIAKLNNVSTYAVDKIFWLIGSGDFYRSNIKIGQNRSKFIEKVKSKIELLN
ncbi:MAG: hypothetical protein ABIQ27_07185 [Flavobacterium sp.]|uniref:hypothetical protein n=1 Tax=Flavobacterium sp. TaxID=239 RepID=UPI003267A95C